MKQKWVSVSARLFILLSAFSMLYVSVLALFNPQEVMNLVHVKLENNDAFSSIRGVYGGVGLALVISLAYLAVRDYRKGLLFLCLLWGFYALSRVITIMAEGALGSFGTQWLLIESTFFTIALVLALVSRKSAAAGTTEELLRAGHVQGTCK